VGGALLRYADTPVGPYDEVLGVVGTADGLRPVGTVAFMAVDSEASVVGGRVNWGMPKTLAAFDRPDAGRTVAATVVGGGGSPWQVAVTARPVGPSLPVALRLVAGQQFPDGRVGHSTLRARGRARLAVVTVDVSSAGPLPTWLRPGRHLGTVLSDAAFDLQPPRFR
jgi:hypothetical protein